ncbi:MAG: acyloxyacyl hydrolase [Ignavibacteria bacterium]|nr:acyloxyacyl hydrolase [Ignavibacteria bacterium]
MIIKLGLALAVFFVSLSELYSQDFGRMESSLYKPQKTASSQRIFIGGGIGFAFINNSNEGLDLNFFTEIKSDNFSIVPMANYWKNDTKNNFEIAGLARFRLKSTAIEPYFDAGLGVNFLTDRDEDKNNTNLGIDLGAGLDFIGISDSFSIFADGKYKIIVGSPNLYYYTLIGGIKFYI